MKQNTAIRIGTIALLIPLWGGISALACPQDEFQPLENLPVSMTRNQEPLTGDPQLDNQDAPANLPELLEDALTVRPKPAALVDRRLAGWQRAGLGTDGGRLSDVLGANWVIINELQGLDGRLVGVNEPVTLNLLRGGFRVAEVTSDEFGVFRFESATPGPYTLVGNSMNFFFFFGFVAVENNKQTVDMPLVIEPLPVTGAENIRLITKYIRQYSPMVRFDPYPVYDIGEASDDPPEYYGWNGLKYLAQQATPATTIEHHAVAILRDGRMVGRFHQVDNRTGRPVEVRNTDIKIIQDGELIAEAQTDVLGIFEVTGLTPGDYALFAGGIDGLAVIGLELFDASSIAANPSTRDDRGRHRQVAFNRETRPLVFDALLVDPESTGWINAYAQEQEYLRAVNEPRPELASQMPYDYFSYPGGGGGGGYGGGEFGGGFGELLLLGAFGVAIADAARTETVFGGGIPVVSPFFP